MAVHGDLQKTQLAQASPIPLFKFLQALIAAVGLGTLLYAIGFLALRAHYAALGTWPGTLDNQEITDEGGRFLYHLLFLPVQLLRKVGWTECAVVLIAPLAIGLLDPWFQTVFRRPPPRSAQSALGKAAKIAVLGVAVLASALLVETVWVVWNIEDLLFAPVADLHGYGSEKGRLELYNQVLWRFAAVSLIGILLWRWAWPRAILVERALILAQWLITAAALGSWPMAYGKLVISDVRPLLVEAGPAAAQQRRFLLRATEGTYYIWNKTDRRLDVQRLGTGGSLTLGPRGHLLE
jgi:hypothetical protein